MIQGLKEHRLEIGIVLALAGIQFSVIIKSIISISFDLTNIIFFISLLLITDYSTLLSGKLYIPRKAMTLTLGYNLFVALLGIFTGASLWASGNGLIYTLYTIVFIGALMTNIKYIDGEFLVSFMWASMGILSTFLFYLITDGLTNFGGTIMRLSSGADRLSLSGVAFFYLCAMLLYRSKNWFFIILKVLFAVVSLYDVMACSRRGLMVALVVIFIYHLWQNATLQINGWTILKIAGVIILVFFSAWLSMKLISNFGTLINNYIERLIRGVFTYFGNTSSGVDAAAINRNSNINNFSELFNSGTLLQQFWGHGYAYFWMDVPYLQAFIDLGLFGGIWYLIVQLFIPIRILLRRTNNSALRFAQYFAIIAITYNIYSGVPYGNVKFVPTVLMIYIAYYESIKERSPTRR